MEEAFVRIPAGPIKEPAETEPARFLDLGRKEYVDGAITPQVLRQLEQGIRQGRLSMVTLSQDEYPEERFLEIDIQDGWAVLSYQAENGDWYSSYNPAYAGSRDYAPAEVGGQSPVTKDLALDNLNLAAEAALWFAKTGGLWPGIDWAKFQG